MKSFQTPFLGLVLLSVALGLLKANHTETISQMSLDEIEALSQDETGHPDPVVDCIKGGPGIVSCSNDGCVPVCLGGLGDHCSITCNQGYYACCGYTCTCIPNGH